MDQLLYWYHHKNGHMDIVKFLLQQTANVMSFFFFFEIVKNFVWDLKYVALQKIWIQTLDNIHQVNEYHFFYLQN